MNVFFLHLGGGNAFLSLVQKPEATEKRRTDADFKRKLLHIKKNTRTKSRDTEKDAHKINDKDRNSLTYTNCSEITMKTNNSMKIWKTLRHLAKVKLKQTKNTFILINNKCKYQHNRMLFFMSQRSKNV